MSARSCILLLLFFVCCWLSPVYAIDNPHFYRATNFFGEPRIQLNGLGTFDFSFGYGSTKTARNMWGHKTPLLDIYGPQNIQYLGVGVPCIDPTNPYDMLLTELALMPSSCGFGFLSFRGKFSIIELYLNYAQNFPCGFFVQGVLPIRRLKISNITQCDLSPNPPRCPNNQDVIWQSVLDNLDTILSRHCLCLEGPQGWGAGDLALLFGWTTNYQRTEVLDFIDLTVQTGVLVPTSHTVNQNRVFDIPYGYNGHVGVPICADVAFGLYEWLTLGAYANAIIFANRDVKNMRMKTSSCQNGFIKLAQGCATEKEGDVWTTGMFLKADHWMRGLSCLIGYVYAQQKDSSIVPTDTVIFDPAIVNSDPRLRGFTMHTINLLAEYDAGHLFRRWAPRFGFFVNVVVGGKNIFDTNVGGFKAGFDIAFTF